MFAILTLIHTTAVITPLIFTAVPKEPFEPLKFCRTEIALVCKDILEASVLNIG